MKLFLAFLICGLAFAEPHSDKAKAKQVRESLKVAGALNDKELDSLIDTPGIYPSYALGMIDPLVHRQASPKPFQKPLPGPGFQTLGELQNAMKKHPNKDALPKMSTKFWSKELRAKLLPIIVRDRLGEIKGSEYLFSATEVLSIITSIGPEGLAPPPGFPAQPTLNKVQWDEFRDFIGELAIRYKAALETGPNWAATMPDTH